MPSTVEKLSTTRVKLTIEVPFDDLKPIITKTYRDLANQFSIPGFRKGHVPPAIIDQRVGRGAVLSEAINAYLPEVYARAVEENKLVPLSTPEVDIEKLEDGEQVVFTAEVDVRPDFDLPDFAAIKVTVEAAETTAKAVDERVNMLRERFAEIKEVSRKAKKGDQITITLVAAQNGEELPDASAEGLTYVIGTQGMLDGLDEAATGLKAGESATFTSTLVGGDHEGEQADVTVTVTKVDERVLPEVNDEFAQLVSEFDTVEEMRVDLGKTAERVNIYTQISEARDKVLDEALAQAGFDLPVGLVDREVASRKETLMEQLKAAGLTLAAYLERVGDPEQATEEAFDARLTKDVEKGIRTEILMSRIAEETDVRVDQEDLTNFIFQKAQENGTNPEQELQHMQEHNHLGEWMSQIRASKALDALVAKASVKDSKGKKVDIASILMPVKPEPGTDFIEVEA